MAWVVVIGALSAVTQARTATIQSGSCKTLVAIPRWRRVDTAIRILGRNVRVRQAAFYQRWQAEGPGTGWVILVNE